MSYQPPLTPEDWKEIEAIGEEEEEDGERVLSDKANQIWDLLWPYIGTDDGPDYNEAEMEKLCGDTLPKVWMLVLEMEDGRAS